MSTLRIYCTADYTKIGTAIVTAVDRAAFAIEVEAASYEFGESMADMKEGDNIQRLERGGGQYEPCPITSQEMKNTYTRNCSYICRFESSKSRSQSPALAI